MPIVLPAEPWKATGRWQLYGDKLFKLTDRHGRDMMLGPTQEEVVALLAAAELPSLPRPAGEPVPGRVEVPRRVPSPVRAAARARVPDEGRVLVRPRRGRHAGVLPSHVRGVRARSSIGCGLDYGDRRGGPRADRRRRQPRVHGARRASARTCSSSARTATTAADIEAAPAAGAGARSGRSRRAAHRGRHARTRRRSSRWRRCSAWPPSADAEVRDVRRGRARRSACWCPATARSTRTSSRGSCFPATVRPFDDDDFAARGFAKGYVGPQGFADDVTVFADLTVRGGRDWVTGREPHGSPRHGRERGPRLPRGPVGGPRRVPRGRPLPDRRRRAAHRPRRSCVGHIYQLGTKYSEPLEATFLDEDGAAKPYRDGLLRHRDHAHHGGGRPSSSHDDDGLIWPKVLAPFEVIVVIATRDDEAGGRGGRADLRGARRARGRDVSWTTARSAPA